MKHIKLNKDIIICMHKDMVYSIFRGCLYSYSITSKERIFLLKLPISKLNQFLLNFAFLRRAFRLEFFSEILKTKNPLLIILYKETVYRIDLTNNKIIDKQDYPLKGKRPLNSDTIKDLNGFDDGIYYGEYFSNFEKHPVSIYKLSDCFERVYQFREGEINHIHAIVSDYYRNCLWIMTGDFDNGSSIWMAKDNFKEVVCIYRGEQKFRSCVGFVFEEGLLYATDSPNDVNSLRLIKIKHNEFENIELCKLNGPSIYGVKLKDYCVFSTSTEPEYKIKLGYLNLFSTKPAKGIRENKSFLIKVDDRFNVTTIHKANKDFFPYGLFQFGTFKFPRYIDVNHNILFTFSVGNQIKDYKSLELNLNNTNHVC